MKVVEKRRSDKCNARRKTRKKNCANSAVPAAVPTSTITEEELRFILALYH